MGVKIWPGKYCFVIVVLLATHIAIQCSEMFKVSKMEYNKFRFTCFDVKTKDEKINISIEDYTKLLGPITKIWKAGKEEKLTKLELKYYKYIQEIFPSWHKKQGRIEFH